LQRPLQRRLSEASSSMKNNVAATVADEIGGMERQISKMSLNCPRSETVH
jgi:hypothetical protein